MPILVSKRQLQRFREQLYRSFQRRADSSMDLLDALCSNDHAPSVVELSLNPLFRRGYSALYKAIGESFGSSLPGENVSQSEEEKTDLIGLVAQVVPPPQELPFLLLGLDCTPRPRLHARTLEDRSFVHEATSIKGNKPITIGHSYSMLSVIPERNDEDAPWTIPLDMSRVPTSSNSTMVGHSQVNSVLSNPNGPWFEQLCVLDVDSAYGNKKFLGPMQENENLVTVARCRSNRVFYQSPIPSLGPPRRGHPTWYGERFDLRDKDTWHEPDEVAHTSYKTRRGRKIEVTITGWHRMLMRGDKVNPMHQYPFTLLRIESVDELGHPFLKPMWLIVMGERRDELSLVQAYWAYRRRFDLEHSFRFQKQNLLLTAFETSELEHEQAWVKFVMLAYVQLWAAHLLAIVLPKPWESQNKTNSSARIGPSKVQRDWFRIISRLGTPANESKPRGNSPGRQLGQSQTLRIRLPVVKKGKSKKTHAKKAA